MFSFLPIHPILIPIKLELFGHAYLAESVEDKLLLVGGQEAGTAAALKVGVAGEMGDAEVHELGILLWEHLLLEVGESAGEGYGDVAAEVRTTVVLGAVGWVEEAQQWLLLELRCVCKLVKALR